MHALRHDIFTDVLHQFTLTKNKKMKQQRIHDRTKANKEGYSWYKGEKKLCAPIAVCHKQPLCSRCVTGRNVAYVTSEST